MSTQYQVPIAIANFINKQVTRTQTQRGAMSMLDFLSPAISLIVKLQRRFPCDTTILEELHVLLQGSICHFLACIFTHATATSTF